MFLSFLVPLLFTPALQVKATLPSLYTQAECYVGRDFLNPAKWTYFSDADPTHGRVNYVNATLAKSANLTVASDNSFIARADYTTVLSPDGPGRNSVRMISNTYFTEAVIIIDLQHMPQGCATWPAIWTLGADWPNNGEVDIVEGVNDQSFNQATLHTSPNCTIPTRRRQTGTSISDNCDVNVNFNQGCGVAFKNGTFGTSFNEGGGGWFAMERTQEFIKVWSWARCDDDVPLSVRYASESPVLDTQLWGRPVAYFPNTSCDFSSKFGPHQIIFDLTLCGDWAGQEQVYAASGCPSTCVDFVNNNPAAFENAYFEFNSITVYEPQNWGIFPRRHYGMKRGH